MKRSASKGAGGWRWVAGMAALGVSLALGTAAHASPQYDLKCDACHTMPPLDSTNGKKNPYNGAIPGNHETHSTAAVNSCVVCHGANVITYDARHRQKAIALEDGQGYSRKQGGFLNQTSLPPNPLGTCSTTACHSDGKGKFGVTPAWGSAKLDPTLQSSCSTCHDIAPATGNHPSLLGAGKKHGDYYGTGVGSCGKCHSDYFGRGAASFQHATSGGKRAIDMRFAGGGNYSTSKSECSNVYCHSNGKGVFAPATWGATLDCSGCHGTATSGTLSVKHEKHVNNAARLGSNYGCAECHATTVTNDTTIADISKHTNGGPIDFGGPRLGTVDTGTGTCATTYCHTDGRGTPKVVTWTQSQTVGCNGCHGAETGAGTFVPIAGEPNYQNAGVDNPRANSHQKHMKAAGDCKSCHGMTTDDGASIRNSGTHLDGSIETAPGTGITFTMDNKSCSNISCHNGNSVIADRAAKWGDSTGCATCHGDAATINTNAHAKHISGMGYGCVTCHSATVVDNTTIKPGAPHLDGSGVNTVGTGLTFTSADKTCATACHGTARPAWNGGATDCSSCHGGLTGSTGGLISSGAHTAHYAGNAGPQYDGTTTTACSICHVYTTDTAGTHADATVELQSGYNKVGVCSTCHTVTTTDWNAGAVSCESCHAKSASNNNTLSVINGKTAGDVSADATSGHGAAGKACADCHDASTPHLGVVGGTKRLIGGVTGDAECNSCHGNPGKVQAKSLISQVHDSTANTCASCHNPHGSGNKAMVSSTLAETSGVIFNGTDFVNAAGTGVCQACHTTTTYYKKNVQEAIHNLDSTSNCLNCHPHTTEMGTAFQPLRNCDSCHGYPPVPKNLGWTKGVDFAKQGFYSSARFEDYSGGGGAHVTLSHVAANVTQQMGWGPCLMCHYGGESTHGKTGVIKSNIQNVTVTVDPQYRFSTDVQFMGYTEAKLVTGGNQTGTCFNVSCHFRKTTPWSTEK